VLGAGIVKNVTSREDGARRLALKTAFKRCSPKLSSPQAAMRKCSLLAPRLCPGWRRGPDPSGLPAKQHSASSRPGAGAWRLLIRCMLVSCRKRAAAGDDRLWRHRQCDPLRCGLPAQLHKHRGARFRVAICTRGAAADDADDWAGGVAEPHGRTWRQ